MWAGVWICLLPALCHAQALPTPDTQAPPAPSTDQVPGQGTPPPESVSQPGRAKEPQTTPQAGGRPFRIGSFLIYPQLDIARLYDNNVYSTNTDALSDRAWIVSPAIWVQSNWTKHAINLHAGWDMMRYDEFDGEDTNDRHFSAEGRYDFSPDANVYGGALFTKDHEDRESPSDRNGVTPTPYQQGRLYGGLFNQFGRVSMRIAATGQDLDYDDVNFINGAGVSQPINNDDRDRRQYTGGLRLGYELNGGAEPYVLAAFDNRRYDDALDDLDYQRDSNGDRYLAGVRWGIPGKVKLDAFAGRLRQRYEDARLASVNAPLAGANLQWQIAARTTLSAQVDRTVQDTTVTFTPAPGATQVASSYLNTTTWAGLDHRLADKWSVRANGSVSRVAYQGIERDDEYRNLGIGLTYRLDINFIVELDLASRQLESSLPSEDFSKRTASLRFVVPFSHRS